MAFCKNHDHIYFDKLCRTKKAETVLSLIYATYQVKKNCLDETKTKDEIAKRLVDAYNLFKFDAGTYNGSADQFESQYTIGHELGIWKNSDLDLTDLAIDVAEGKKTIKEYFDIVFLNYIQPINNKIEHLLYRTLDYVKNNKIEIITKEDIKNAFAGINNSSEHINSLYNMFIGTSYFKETDNGLVLNYDINEILKCCDITYMGKDYEEVKDKFSNLDEYLSYLLKDNRSPELILNRKIDNSRRNRNMNKYSESKAKGGFNKIYYGAPGCGKSYKLKKNLETIDAENIIRTTFHPEYSNTDFVGQILPHVNEDKSVTYDFNPGPFTLALEKAYQTDDMVYLVIEEINRGNASAIFGDLFQLLDREKADNENPYWGQSEYPINSPHIQRYLGFEDNDSIVIPTNLTILATMNSSDQNVFTLDTAFKRRWKFELVDNDIVNDNEHSYKNWFIPFSNVTWETFLLAVNEKIMSSTISQLSEDKRLGKYFVTKDCLVQNRNGDHEEEAAKNFSYKVLEYLWNDVCKINRDEWFNLEQYQTLEDLIEDFIAGCECDDSLQIFKDKELMFKDEN